MSELYTRHGVAIVNPYGSVWTDRIFENEAAALVYLEEYWGNKDDRLNSFSMKPAKMTITLIPNICGACGQEKKE